MAVSQDWQCRIEALGAVPNGKIRTEGLDAMLKIVTGSEEVAWVLSQKQASMGVHLFGYNFFAKIESAAAEANREEAKAGVIRLLSECHTVFLRGIQTSRISAGHPHAGSVACRL